MKIYIREQQVTLVGKSWQIKYLLKKYMQKYSTVQEWIDSQQDKCTYRHDDHKHQLSESLENRTLMIHKPFQGSNNS